MIRTVAGFVLACAFVVSSFGSASAQQSATPAESALQSALDARVANVAGTGIVVGIVDHGRESVYYAGTPGTNRALDADTIFEIGSVTKTFTATVLAEMVQDGSVKLDAPVSKYLPKGVHVPSSSGAQITLLNLAEQRSGLPRLPDNMSDVGGSDPYADYTRANMFAFLNGYSLTRAPGSSYEYSNFGIGLLGQALADRAGTSYERLVTQRVLTPLHMTATSFATMPPQTPATFAVGHDLAGQPVEPWHFGSMMPAGGIRSSLSDMLKYLRCNMGQGPLAKACLFAQTPRADSDPGHRIGLVWETNPASGVVSHGGDTVGFHAYVAIARDHQTGVVVMSNGPVVADIAAHVLDSTFPIAQCPTSVAADRVDPAAYAGVYCNPSSGLVFAVAPGTGDDALSIALLPQPAASYKRTAADTFSYASVGATVRFVRADGRIVGIWLDQHAQQIPFLRLDAGGKPFVNTIPSQFPPAVTLDGATLQEYVGSYVGGDLTFTVTLAGDQLMVRLTGQLAIPVYASAKDRFYYKIVDAQIDFNRDASGKITSLTLHQNGRDITAARSPM